jgi:xanthine dehydrogenase YagT iron-sulfur-binding subunit
MPEQPTDTSNDSNDSNDNNVDQKQTAKGTVTRRSFLTHMSAAGIAAAVSPLAAAANEKVQPVVAEIVEAEPVAGAIPVTLTINKQKHSLTLDPRTSLLDCIHENLGITGTKKGCDHGQCGACTVHINGRRVNSCLTLAVMHDGDEITTIEGLGQPDNMHPLQSAFVECDAYQCGYCTSGQLMSAAALLHEPCGAHDDDVREAMSGNICRCGAYPNIIEAIQKVRKNA